MTPLNLLKAFGFVIGLIPTYYISSYFINLPSTVLNLLGIGISLSFVAISSYTVIKPILVENEDKRNQKLIEEADESLRRKFKELK